MGIAGGCRDDDLLFASRYPGLRAFAGVVRPAILYLVIVERRSYAEAAPILGCRVDAARTRASRALRRLRVELDSEFEELRDA